MTLFKSYREDIIATRCRWFIIVYTKSSSSRGIMSCSHKNQSSAKAQQSFEKKITRLQNPSHGKSKDNNNNRSNQYQDPRN
mmetsp:Transcript_32201/g.35813  ORF Transcript_32201/g.35813 Transcript_32201/m.35813 type:complete len:81 (+) Transcript_32201:163-405(+)